MTHCFSSDFKDAILQTYNLSSVAEWGPVVPGKLPVPGRPTIWMKVGQGPTALVVDAGGCCSDFFYSTLSFFSSFSLSLGDGLI